MIRLRNLLTEANVKKTSQYVSGDTYVSKEDVLRVYKNMGYDFDVNEFYKGMNVEMEHQDVTEGSLVKTAMIAAAHLREIPNYYTLLLKYVEKKRKLKEQEGASVGLVSPSGTINAAPKPKDVRKMRKFLNKQTPK